MPHYYPKGGVSIMLLCSTITNQQLLAATMKLSITKWHYLPQFYHLKTVTLYFQLYKILTLQYESTTVWKQPLQPLWKCRWFLLQKEAIMCHHKIDTFAVSKDEWNTKENTGECIVRTVPDAFRTCWHLLTMTRVIFFLTVQYHFSPRVVFWHRQSVM